MIAYLGYLAFVCLQNGSDESIRHNDRAMLIIIPSEVSTCTRYYALLCSLFAYTCGH
jgi:hypothetical protein